MEVKVGDEVIVTGRHVRTGRTTVAKVGRKYFYLQGTGETAFQISDGREKPDGYGSMYKARAWWPDDYEADQVRTGVLKQLSEHGVRWAEYGRNATFRQENFSTLRLFELLNLLNNIADDNAVADLDRNNT